MENAISEWNVQDVITNKKKMHQKVEWFGLNRQKDIKVKYKGH